MKDFLKKLFWLIKRFFFNIKYYNTYFLINKYNYELIIENLIILKKEYKNLKNNIYLIG